MKLFSHVNAYEKALMSKQASLNYEDFAVSILHEC